MTGDNDETISNPEGPSSAEEGTVASGRGLVVQSAGSAKRILEEVLGRDGVEPEAGTSVDDPARSLPTEMRRIRRGKFFLSNYEQEQFGSISRPIFEYYCHKAVVGETVTTPDGIWCYAAHNDFDLIPEFQPPSSWPEYIRTPTGWKRADIGAAVSDLFQRIADTKRLRYEGEKS